VGGRAAHDPGEVRIRRPCGFVVRAVLANGLKKILPLGLPGAAGLARRGPVDLALVDLLALVDVHGGGVHIAGELRGSLAAVDERSERIDPLDHRLAPVGEGVLHHVVVHVLAAIARPVHRGALARRRDRPAVLDPTAFVDLVDQEFQHEAGAGPEEVYAVVDLPGDVIRAGRRFAEEVPAAVPRGADQSDVAQFARADLLDQHLPGDTMAALNSGRDLDVPLLRRLARRQDAAAAGRVGREALLHEHVYALLHRVLDLHGAAVGVGREHGHVARPQAVDRVAIRVEPDETAVGGHVDPIVERLLQHAVSAVDALVGQVGHRMEFDRTGGDRERVGNRPAAPAAAADQGQADRVVRRSVHARHARRKHRACGDCSAELDHVAASGLGKRAIGRSDWAIHGRAPGNNEVRGIGFQSVVTAVKLRACGQQRLALRTDWR